MIDIKSLFNMHSSPISRDHSSSSSASARCLLPSPMRRHTYAPIKKLHTERASCNAARRV
eukprot:CAMPEP_0198583476 /NCGR_PEP_ID=MMETSP1462-20131121/126782_1 /TAXON_ID=1333877 /ORGANISM="Brandtodinium nutriculum, Strain RCC3387" /LENGTH=59 /DNA_ID=CAMNT_0044314891 /DNA_START=72 /DNA_END=251 /DNA_ORIENTATION=-